MVTRTWGWINNVKIFTKKLIQIFCILIISFLIVGCGAEQQHASRNTEVVTTYFGKEAQRSGGKWSSQHWLTKRLEEPGEFVVIFAAPWCKTCNLLERGVKQAQLKAEIYWLNVDQPWVSKVASIMGIKQIPIAILMDNKKEQAIRSGTGPILVFLLSRY